MRETTTERQRDLERDTTCERERERGGEATSKAQCVTECGDKEREREGQRRVRMTCVRERVCVWQREIDRKATRERGGAVNG